MRPCPLRPNRLRRSIPFWPIESADRCRRINSPTRPQGGFSWGRPERCDPARKGRAPFTDGMGDRPSLRCSFLRSCDLALLTLSCTTRRYIQLPPPMPQARHITGSPPSRCSGPAIEYNAVLCRWKASLVWHDDCARPWPPQSSRQTAQASPMPSDSLRSDLWNQAGSQKAQRNVRSLR